MKLQLPRNSLFAILIRSQWWVSALVALGVFGVTRLLLPPGFAAFAALPFVVIASYAGWQQLMAPGARKIAATLDRHRAMSWDGFAAALEEAFRREGYAASRSDVAQVDLELRRDGKISLVACKRWKAVRTGVEPLRELHAAARERGAHELVYVAVGEVTGTASAFAAQNKIRLLRDAELAKLLARVR